MGVEPSQFGYVPVDSLEGIFGDGPVGQVCEDIALLLESHDVPLLDERDFIIKAALTFYNPLGERGEKVSLFIQRDLGYRALSVANSLQKYLDDIGGFPTQTFSVGSDFATHYQFVSDAMLDSLSFRARNWVSADAQYLIGRTPEKVLDLMLVAMQKRFDYDCGWQFNDIHELLVKPLARYEEYTCVGLLRNTIQTIIDYFE